MNIKVADQAWIAAAALHREHPGQADFSLREIAERAGTLFGGGDRHNLQPGVWQHIVSHGVAQNPPTPNRRRFFTQTDRGRRRLYRPGDAHSAERQAGKTHPDRDALPEEYRELVDWYERRYAASTGADKRSSPRSGGDNRPQAYIAFVGLIPAYDLNIIKERIERDCENVDEENEQGR